MALLDASTVEYFSMGEASGNTTGAHNGKVFTDNNTVTSGTGIVGNARSFASASAEYFSRADDPDFDFGTGDYSINLWFKRATSGNQWLIGKRQDGNNIWYISIESNNSIVGEAIGSGVTFQKVQTLNAHSATGVWKMLTLVMDRDSSTGTNLYINGTVESKAALATATTNNIDNTGAINIGRWGGGALYWDGLIDEIFITKRVITAAEVTWLYNGGAGRNYADMVAEADPTAAVTGNLSNVAVQSLSSLAEFPLTSNLSNVTVGTVTASAPTEATATLDGVSCTGSVGNVVGVTVLPVTVGEYRHVAPGPIAQRQPMRLKDLERIYKQMERKR